MSKLLNFSNYKYINLEPFNQSKPFQNKINSDLNLNIRGTTNGITAFPGVKGKLDK